MKITWIKKINEENWHTWFAWHPVWIDNELIVFETVERRLIVGEFDLWWEYRRLNKTPKNTNFSINL